MHSKISSPLELSHSGTEIAAHGPVTGWEVDEVSADITVTIAQNGVSATKTTTVLRGASSWGMALVADNREGFTHGQADGTAAAAISLSGGGTEGYDWSNPVKLKD
jgi:hypothetical protein